MSKDEKPKKLVPRLRFPEFQDAGDWEEATVGERSKTFSGGTPSTSNKSLYGGDIPFIRSAEIGKEQTELTITQEALEVSAAKLVERGDLLVALYGANSGDAALAGTSGAINQAILCLRTKESTPFLFHFLTERKNWIISTYLQGGQGNLSGDIVKSVPLSFPKPAEQRKIAECLGSLDDWIVAETEALAALRRHKTGLMQQLFPRPGETRPRRRFPEFRNAGEWKCKPLGKLLDGKPSYGVNAAAVSFSEDLPTYVRITDIDDDGRLVGTERVSVDIEASSDDYLHDGDIVLARTGASVGKSYRYRTEDGRLVYAGFLIRIRPNPKLLNSNFLASYLFTGDFWDWVRLTSARSGQPGINGAEYACLPIPIPPPTDGEPTEQRRIADCLTSLDALIAAKAEKLATMRNHKRGLMQQLFPAPDAAEGGG